MSQSAQAVIGKFKTVSMSPDLKSNATTKTPNSESEDQVADKRSTTKDNSSYGSNGCLSAFTELATPVKQDRPVFRDRGINVEQNGQICTCCGDLVETSADEDSFHVVQPRANTFSCFRCKLNLCAACTMCLCKEDTSIDESSRRVGKDIILHKCP